jgi:hypothetical protein
MTLHDLAMGPGAYEKGGGAGPSARVGAKGGAYEKGGGAGPPARGRAMPSQMLRAAGGCSTRAFAVSKSLHIDVL